MAEQKPRRPDFVDISGQSFGHLTVIQEATKPGGSVMWLCRCPNGREVRRAASDLRKAPNARCSRGRCPCSRADETTFLGANKRPPATNAPLPTPASAVLEPRPLDPERNRERYVRLKLHLRTFGLEPKPFAELTCSECPEAPTCPRAFDDFNTDGECLEEK